MSSTHRPRTVFAAPLPHAIVAVAKSLAPPALDLVVADQTQPLFVDQVHDAEFVVTGFVRDELNAAFYAAAPRLKLVQLIGAGYDGIDLAAARTAGVPVATNGGANAAAVAEHTLLLMLAVLRRLPTHHADLAAGSWRPGGLAAHPMFELGGKQLGLIGFGAIGQEVARRARAFDMVVRYHSRRRLPDKERALDVGFMTLTDLLASSDVVSLHVPLADSTRHLLGAAEFEVMKPTAVLINTARGAVVDQAALRDALAAGRLLGAGLDVFAPEPPARDEPLLRLPNVVLTPHIAGPTVETWQRSFRNAFANVQRVAAGERPLWVVSQTL